MTVLHRFKIDGKSYELAFNGTSYEIHDPQEQVTHMARPEVLVNLFQESNKVAEDNW